MGYTVLQSTSFHIIYCQSCSVNLTVMFEVTLSVANWSELHKFVGGL
jgi:hypothetical protein